MKIYAVYGPGLINGVPYNNERHVHQCLSAVPDVKKLLIGGGKGVDVIARQWCDRNKIPYELVPPNNAEINILGKSGVFVLRDAKMLMDADGCIIFSNPGLPYVAIMSAAMQARKNVLVFHI